MSSSVLKMYEECGLTEMLATNSTRGASHFAYADPTRAAWRPPADASVRNWNLQNQMQANRAAGPAHQVLFTPMSCHFHAIHGGSRLGPQALMDQEQRLYKTRLCQYHQRGVCRLAAFLSSLTLSCCIAPFGAVKGRRVRSHMEWTS